jgi:hypothetical protein
VSLNASLTGPLSAVCRSTWLEIVKNLAHYPRTETVPLPSGCSLLPEQYTRLQRSFLDLVEAARHFRQAGRCLWWSWLGVRASVRESAVLRVFCLWWDFDRKKDVVFHVRHVATEWRRASENKRLTTIKPFPSNLTLSVESGN